MRQDLRKSGILSDTHMAQCALLVSTVKYVTRYEKRDRSGFFVDSAFLVRVNSATSVGRVQWCKCEGKILLRSRVIRVFLYPGHPLS